MKISTKATKLIIIIDTFSVVNESYGATKQKKGRQRVSSGTKSWQTS